MLQLQEQDLIRMAKYHGLEFVGIVEHLGRIPSYDYCILDNISGRMAGSRNVQFLGELVADKFGKNFRNKITYEPPKGTDIRGTERGLTPKEYHKFSVLEKDRFEKAVLDALKGKE